MGATIIIPTISDYKRLTDKISIGAVASLQITVPDNNYRVLKCRFGVRSTSGASPSARIVLNALGGTLYDTSMTSRSVASVISDLTANQANITPGLTNISTDDAALLHIIEIDILDYTLASNKQGWINTLRPNYGVNTFQTKQGAFLVECAEALTSVTISLDAGNFGTGSYYEIYGIGRL